MSITQPLDALFLGDGPKRWHFVDTRAVVSRPTP
jgi:hypothetical protein